MSPFIIVGLRVGADLPLDRAEAVVAAAEAAGVAAVRVLDGEPGPVLDPSAVASYLAGRHPGVGWIVEAPTSHNAPYNLARRILSLDRATGGRAGLALRVGDGDEVSDAAVVPAPTGSRGQRWAEYARVLSGLWRSFPATALLGDQEAGVFAADGEITAIRHEGTFYRVAGPLDGPASAQGRPVLVVEDVEELGWDRVAAVADVVVVAGGQVFEARAALGAGLARAGRGREEVALVARVLPDVLGDGSDLQGAVDRLLDWTAANGVDGLELVAGAEQAEPAEQAEQVMAVASGLAARLGPAPGPTLRKALGLPDRPDLHDLDAAARRIGTTV